MTQELKQNPIKSAVEDLEKQHTFLSLNYSLARFVYMNG